MKEAFGARPISDPEEQLVQEETWKHSQEDRGTVPKFAEGYFLCLGQLHLACFETKEDKGWFLSGAFFNSESVFETFVLYWFLFVSNHQQYSQGWFKCRFRSGILYLGYFYCWYWLLLLSLIYIHTCLHNPWQEVDTWLSFSLCSYIREKYSSLLVKESKEFGSVFVTQEKNLDLICSSPICLLVFTFIIRMEMSLDCWSWQIPVLKRKANKAKIKIHLLKFPVDPIIVKIWKSTRAIRMHPKKLI